MSSTVYYVPGMEANFFALRDALYAAANEAERTGHECAVIVDTGNQPAYTYCYIRHGDQVAGAD